MDIHQQHPESDEQEQPQGPVPPSSDAPSSEEPVFTGETEPSESSQTPEPYAPPPAAAGYLGQGELPDEFKRFAWGPFFMAPIWGAVYGSWRVVSWWMLTWLIPIVLVSVVDPTAGGVEGSTLALITVIADFAGSAIRLWVGMHAFAWLWQRETMRLQLVPGAVPRVEARTFLARQRSWTIAGVGLLVASLGGLTIMLTSTDTQIVEMRDLWGLSQLEVGLAMAWMVVELGLAAYLAATMRPGAAKDASEEAE